MKPFRNLFKEFFQSADIPPLTENSSLHEIAALYTNLYSFIERKYGIKPEPDDRGFSLKEFVEKFRLPPAPVVFMEVQLDSRDVKLNETTPKELKEELNLGHPVKLLDVREDWELKIGKLEGSIPLTASLLDEILTKWEKKLKIVLYCHHGIRSTDAALFLVDRGFSNVSILKGGIEAWSLEVDPSTPRYQGAYC